MDNLLFSKTVYDQLLQDEIEFILVKKNGTIITDASEFRDYFKTHYDFHPMRIIPGSFNPLHDAHKELYEMSIGKSVFKLDENNNPTFGKEDKYSVFEMSIYNWEKPSLLFEETEKRVKQFVNYAPILLTKEARFINKIGLLRNILQSSYLERDIYFYVGVDTFRRMKSDYGIKGLLALSATFFVYNRFIDGVLVLASSEVKNILNCVVPKTQMSLDLMKISSTEIRKQNKT